MTRQVYITAIGCSLLVILTATLYPFRLVPSALYALPITLRVFLRATTYAGDIGSNLLLFMPLGAALLGLRLIQTDQEPEPVPSQLTPQPRLKTELFRILRVALLVSTGVETVQFLIPSRTSSLADIIANGLGAVLGAIALAAIYRVLTTPLSKPGWLAWPGRSLMLVFWLLLCFSTTHALNHQSRLSNWDAGYQLNIGHSGSTNHPWQGNIEKIIWLNRAVSPPVVFSHLTSQLLKPVAAPQQAAFGSQKTSVLPPVLFHYQAGQVQTSVGAEALRNLIADTSEFTLQARFSSNTVESKSLASLFSFSQDIWFSNCVLVKAGQDIRALVRAPVTGQYHQRWIYLTLPKVIQDTEVHELTLTYKDALLQAYWDGQLQPRRMNLRADRILLHYFLPLKLSQYRLEPWGEVITRLIFYSFWMIPAGLLLMSLRHPLKQKRAEIRLMAYVSFVVCGLIIIMLWQRLLLPESESTSSLMLWILTPLMLGSLLEVGGSMQLRKFKRSQLQKRQTKR